VRLLSRIHYNTLERLPQIHAPVLVAHSRDDEIVPFAHGEKLFAAANEPKEFLEMSGGHNEAFIYSRADWVRQVATFLDRHSASR
jgi:fermentation-respiration switch protein FrsA (DUF1100 family)